MHLKYINKKSKICRSEVVYIHYKDQYIETISIAFELNKKFDIVHKISFERKIIGTQFL
jgi:hypothetical protein